MSDVPVAPSAPQTKTAASTPVAPKAPQSNATHSVSGAAGSAPPDSRQVAPNSQKPSIADQIKPKGGQEAPAQTEERKEAERRKYKLKVNGQEREEALTDDEVAVRLQKSYASDERFQESAEIKKRINALIEYGKSDPAGAFKELFGVEFDEIAEKRLAERYKEATLPPHEREKLELQKKIQEYESREKKAKEQHEAQQRQAYEQKVYQDTEQEFLAALKTGGLPQNRETLYMMAEIAKINLMNGIELTPAQMATEVKARMHGQTKHVVSALKGDALLEALGDDVVNEAIRARLEKMKVQATPVAPPKPPPVDQVPKSKEPIGLKEWRKKHRVW